MTHSFWAAAAGELGYATGVAPPPRLSERTRELMAVRFRALGEPMRLKILERLFRSPASVGEILDSVGGTQANVSKHLAVLRTGRLVSGRKEGNRTVYSISDPALERLCSVVCEAVSRDARAEARAVAGAQNRRGRRPA
jgi:DNA-binding transcriptional ArsR family regulator